MKYFAILFLLIAVPVRAQDCCRVEGVVLSAAGTVIAGADVMLSSPDLKQPQLTKTAADGRYAFAGVRPGIRVEVRVVADGRPIAAGYTLVTDRVERLDIKAPPEISSPGSVEDLDPMGGDSAEVRGVVRGADGSPVSGAVIAIAGTPIVASTDSAGRYSFGRVRSKLTITLQIAAAGFKPATAEIAVPVGGATDSDVVLAVASGSDRESAPVVQTAPDRAAVTLTRETAAAVPRLMGEDVAGATQFLSAAATGLDESQLFVHGGTPDQTSLSVDDIVLYPAARLLGGLSAPFAPSIGGAEIAADPRDTAGAAGPSGLLRLLSTTRGASRPGGSADIGVFGPAAMIAAPLGHAASVTAGARWSWPESFYEKTLDRFTKTDATYVRDRSPLYRGGVLAPSPGSMFSALNGRVDARPGTGNRVAVAFYRADDDGNFSRDVAGPASSTTFAVPKPLDLPSGTAVQVGDVQSWSGGGVSATWQRRWLSDFSTTATFARSRFTSDRAQSFNLTASDGSDLNGDFGRGGSDALTEHDEAEGTTLRITTAIGIGFSHAVEAGVESAALESVYDARTEGSTSLTTLLARSGTGTLWSAFAQDVWRPLAALTVSPGVRITHDGVADVSYADPRVTASYAAAPGIVFRGGWSSDHQSVSRVVREDRAHGDGAFWTLADGTAVPVARSQEASGGMSYQARGVLFDAHVYYRTLDDLTMFAPRLLPGMPLPAAGTGLHLGSGTSTGGEFLVQHHVDRNTLWAAYTASRAEYTFPTLEGATFPASFDRLHQLKVVNSTRVWRGVSVTGAWRAGSGKPYTPATSSEQVWFASGTLAYAPLFSAKNSSRLPAYHQLDVSSQFAHRTGPLTLTAGATVFNVYDRQNIAYYDYEAAGPTLITSQMVLARRAANLFFRVSF